MRGVALLTASAALFSGLAGAVAHVEPRANPGFPSPNQQQLRAIEILAAGELPGGPPPAKLAPSSITAFQLIAFNELFEVAFFSSLLKNVTEGKRGYETKNKEAIVKILETVVAQEELHAIGARSILQNVKAFTPSPCKYKFPTTNLKDAIALAETFTAVVLGTLQDASQLFATNGEAGVVRQVASIIGQEGEQNGFYRTFLDRIPSEKPFLTTSVAAYAFSALQAFVVECPFSLSKIDLPIFPPLNVLSGSGGSDVAAKDQRLRFSADLGRAAQKYRASRGRGLFVTYLTGQNLPISKPVRNVSFKRDVITFEADFPFEENIMFGLTIAGLTTTDKFAGPDDLPAATLAGPGLIQVNEKI